MKHDPFYTELRLALLSMKENLPHTETGLKIYNYMQDILSAYHACHHFLSNYIVWITIQVKLQVLFIIVFASYDHN